MKIRNGFVSNSSSCSFTIYKNMLKPFQICALKYHIEFGKLLGIKHTDEDDRWMISGIEDKNFDGIVCSTGMNNFDMEEFLKKIGVPEKYIPVMEEWG